MTDIASDYYILTIPAFTMPLLVRVDKCSAYQRQIIYSNWKTEIPGLDGIYQYRGNIGIQLNLGEYFSGTRGGTITHQQRLIVTVLDGTIGIENVTIQESITKENIVNTIPLHSFTTETYIARVVYVQIADENIFCMELDFDQLYLEIMNKLQHEGRVLQTQVGQSKIFQLPIITEKNENILLQQTLSSEIFRALPKEELESYDFIFRSAEYIYSCNLSDIVGLVKDSFYTITSTVINPWIMGTYAFQKHVVPIVNPTILWKKNPILVSNTGYLFSGIIFKIDKRYLCLPVDEILDVIAQREKKYTTSTIFPIVSSSMFFTQLYFYNATPVLQINTKELFKQYYANSVMSYELMDYTDKFTYVQEQHHIIPERLEDKQDLTLVFPIKSNVSIIYLPENTDNFLYHEKIFTTQQSRVYLGWFMYNGHIYPVIRIIELLGMKIPKSEYQNVLLITENIMEQEIQFAIALPENFTQQEIIWSSNLNIQHLNLLRDFIPLQFTYERIGFGYVREQKQLLVQIAHEMIKEYVQQNKVEQFTVESAELLEQAEAIDAVRKRINFAIQQLYEDLMPCVVFELDNKYIGIATDIIDSFVGDEQKTQEFLKNQQEEYSIITLVDTEQDIQYFKLANATILLSVQNVYDILHINTMEIQQPNADELTLHPEIQDLLIGKYIIPTDDLILPGETIHLIDPAIKIQR